MQDKYAPEIRITVGGNKIIGLLANKSLFTFQAATGICQFGIGITYMNKTETGLDIDEAFGLDSSYFKTNFNMHLDFEKKKIYFSGNNVYDKPDPIPDPKAPPTSFPLWAIIALSVFVVIVLGIIVWCFIRHHKQKAFDVRAFSIQNQD